MPPGKVSTYKTWAAELRKRQEQEEELGRIERREVEQAASVRTPQPQRTTVNLPIISAPQQPQLAPQRGYDPRFDDPNYGVDPKDRRQAAIVQPQRNVSAPPIQSGLRSDTLASLQAWRPRVDTGPAAFTAQQVTSPTVTSPIRPLGAVQGPETEEDTRANRWNQPSWALPTANNTALLTASRVVKPVIQAGAVGAQGAWDAWKDWRTPEEETQSTLSNPALRSRVEAVRRTPLTPSQMETTRLMQNPLVESGLAANQTAQARDAQAHRDYMRDGLASQPEITRRETWLDTQPAFQQYQQRARENRERAVTGEISPLAALLRGLGNTFLVMPTELAASQRVAGVNADTAAAVNRLAGEELAKPGDRLTLMQVTAPLGSMLNKLNPFLPIFRQDPNIKTVYETAFWKSPTNPNGYESIWDVYNQEIIAAFRLEQAINALPAEQQEKARQTVILNESGGGRQLAALEDLQKKWNAPAQILLAAQWAKAAETRYQMDVARAQAGGFPSPQLMEAAEKRRELALAVSGRMHGEAKRWESMGTSEIIDSHANGWAQLVEGVFLDPINLLDPFTDILVGGVLRGARWAVGKPLSFAKELVAPTKQAVQLLDEALPAARRLGQQVVEGAAPKLPGYNWIDRMAVIGKTADAKAHLDRDVVWSFFARTLTNAQNAQDAQRLINTAIENPSQLVKGVKGLTGQQFQDISGFGGAVKFGGSSVANRELLDRLWLMQAASEDLHALKSLKGDGYNMLEVMAEVDTILYRTAREAYGLKPLENMPLGAVDYRQVAMADGRARLEWLNEKGKVIGSTVPMTARAANEYQKSLRAALKGAQQSPLLRAVRSMDQVQRSVMSDLWLNLRPGHWIRNAMSATATLMTDDLYSLRPVQGILDDLARKGVPDARVMEAMATDVNFGAAGEGMGMDAGQHWSRKVWENNNAYAWANEQSNRMWTGFTHILGNVPFGEQAFYVRAFDRSFSRAFTDLWKGVVNEEIGPRLQAAGLEPTTAARVSDAIISAGVYGNKADIASRVRSVINGTYDPIDLRSLGVPDELVSAEGWKEINEWLKYLNSQKQLAPDAISRAQKGVQRVFVRETERAAEILRQAPLQPGVSDRLAGDAALDGAALVDELTEAGVQGGMTRQQAQEQAVKFAKEQVDQSNQIEEALVSEIARVENPRAMTFAVDAWAKLHALRRQARAQVDELSQAASRYRGTPEIRAELWGKKWQGTQKIYTEMIANMQEVVNDARLALAGGEEAAATFDWWLGIQRYLDYDDALIQEARQTALFATTRDPELWETVVDANRAYVDQAWLPMFHAVRRFPTVDALDVVADVVNRVEMFGATTSSYLRPFREQALAKQLPWDEYWPIRNGAWRHWADMSRTYIEDAQRRITLLGLADSTETKLRWNDPFAGGDFLLAGPGKEGTWFAYRMDDWSVHRFSEAGGESALPEVPKKIIDDWERVIGTDDAQLDAAVEEIRQAAAKVEAPTPTPKIEPTEIARTGDIESTGLIEPEAVLSSNAETPVSLDSNIDDVWQRIKELTAEKRAIREELERVPVGGDGDLGGLMDGVRPLEPLPAAPYSEEINFNKLPYETPTVRPIERPTTGFEDIPPRPTQAVDESIPNADVPAPTLPSGNEAVQRLNSRLAEIDAERARLLDIYSRLRYKQRNGETRLLRGSVDPDAPHAPMPDLPEPPGVEPLMPPDEVEEAAGIGQVRTVVDNRVLTVTGRAIPLPPQIRSGASDRMARTDIEKLDKWLIQQAQDEAISRRDDWNIDQFALLARTSKKPRTGRGTGYLQDADRDLLNDYLFGEENPRWVIQAADSAPASDARLTKPANWQSTQRTAGVQVGDKVQTLRNVYGFEREGTVRQVRGTMVEVDLYNQIRKRVETKRFKLENLKRVDRAPTPMELEEGRKIAEAAGMAQPVRTRLPYETPTMRPVAKPDDIAEAIYPRPAYRSQVGTSATAPRMQAVGAGAELPNAPGATHWIATVEQRSLTPVRMVSQADGSIEVVHLGDPPPNVSWYKGERRVYWPDEADPTDRLGQVDYYLDVREIPTDVRLRAAGERSLFDPTRARYETPTLRQVARPDDIPAGAYGPQPAPKVVVKDRFGKPIVQGDKLKYVRSSGAGETEYTVVNAVPNDKGQIVVQFGNGTKLSVDPSGYMLTPKPRQGEDFALEQAVNTPLGEGLITGFTRRNGEVKSVDVEIDGVQKTFSPENVQPIGGGQEAQSGAIMDVGEDTANGRALTDAGRIGEDDTGALARVPTDDVQRLEAQRPVAGGGRGSRTDDVGRVPQADRAGDGQPRGMGDDARGVVSAAERGERAGIPDTGDRGRPTDGGRAIADDAGAKPKTTETNSGWRDYVISEADNLEDFGGPKARYRANVDAIKTLKRLEAEGRNATPEEQRVLARYSGWGQSELSENVLNEEAYRTSSYPYRSKTAEKWAWANEYDELKKLLSDEEYKAAQASRKNAHFTSPTVVDAMWAGLDRMGLGSMKRLRVLEPSAGVGNFFGRMPTDLAARSTRHAVEIDSITGRIAQKLYPNSRVYVTGFENAPLSDNHYDLVIGNVPFGNYPVFDRLYNNPRLKFLTKSIHNYFFPKALDKARPGGVVAFITSSFTMNAPGAEMVRAHLATRAKLLGAIRLPETAFKRNAGTEVVTDVIFLRKLMPGETPGDIGWVKSVGRIIDGETLAVNKYFADHPEMIVGREAAQGTMYARGGKAYTVLAPEKPLAEALQEAMDRLPQGVLRETSDEQIEMAGEAAEVRARMRTKPGSYVVVGDKLKRATVDGLEDVKMARAGDEMRLRQMMGIRDAARNVLDAQLKSTDDAKWAPAQKTLNDLYDSYTAQYGKLNNSYNRGVYGDDPEAYFVQALEQTDGNKADIFTKRVVHGSGEVTEITNPVDALTMSLRERGRIDMDYMANVLKREGADANALAGELGDAVYRNPGGDWEVADEYLSGNVRRKLEAAKDAAKADPIYQRNVEALEKVQPKDKTASQIYTRLGVGWLDEDTYGLFLKHLLPDVNQRNLQVKYVPGLGQWTLPNNGDIGVNNVNNTAKWGTLRKSALDLLDDRMNARGTVVYDKVGDKSVINPEATEAALQKIEDLEAEFRRWLWEQNPERAANAARMFNDKMNVFVSRRWNGEHLTFAGMNAEKNLRAHQASAVWRALQGNTLLAHEVGTGKTGAITATAMEMRRLGIAKKPMIVVPNHLYAQWPQDVKTWYPFARVLAPTEKDFDAANRSRTMSRIATGDWDVVVVPQSQFVRLPLKPATVQEYIDDELRALRMALLDIDDKRTQKEVEKSIARLEAKLQSMADMTKDNTIFWDDLGVDALLVDEAHDYKNLFFSSRRTRVAGVGAGKDVNRALDMHMKVRMINKLTGNRNVVFATGTPVSNSVSEAYVMMRYLMEPQLEDAGIEHFDAWANVFGREVTELEMSPGGWQTKTRFNQYQNTQQLNQMMQQVMDIVRADEIQTIKIPKMATGERILVESPVTPETESVRVALLDRWTAIKANKVEPTVDNHLKLNTDMSRAGLDIRMYNRSLPDLPNSKINNLVRNVVDVWKRTADDRGTQLVFCEIGVPIKGQKFNVYQEIKDKLVAQGIPPNEVAFIHDALNDDLRNALFRDVNAGRVRVLIGNVQMEKGVNVQQNLYALHHLDGAWKPSTIEQRRGRMFRQGNLWAERGAGEVEEYVYIQPPMDAAKWKLVRQKTAAINNFMRRDYSDDVMEELDEATDAMALIESRASGDPLMKEKVDTEKQLNRLRSLYGAHVDQRTRMQFDVQSATLAIQYAESSKYTAGYLLREMELNKASGIRVNGVQLSAEDELSEAISEQIRLANGELFGTPVELVNVNGVSINLQAKVNSTNSLGKQDIEYFVTLRSPKLDAVVNVSREKFPPTANEALREMRKVRSTLEGESNRAADRIANETRRSAELKALQSQPFERQAELSEAERRLKDVQARIRAQLGGQKTLSPWEAELKDAARTEFVPFKMVQRINAQQEMDGWTDGAMIVLGDAPAGVPISTEKSYQIPNGYLGLLNQWRRSEMATAVGVLMDNKNPRVVLEVGSKGDYIFLAPGRYAETLRAAQGKPVEWRVGEAAGAGQTAIAIVDDEAFALLVPLSWREGEKMAKAKFGAQGASNLGIVAPGTEQAQKVLDFFGIGAEKLWDVTKRTLHKGRHPTVSDVAAHQVRTMADAERKVLEYVGNLSKAAPNKLTAQQRLAIMDAVDTALPRFDDAVYASTQLAKKASDGAMLNFKDRRHFDSALSMIFPFHFFWTRSAKNWAKRVAKHPGILNAYYEIERAVETENNQAGVPSRLRGTLPLWRRADGSQIRIGNPLHYALPFGMYFPQSQYFSEPDENQTEFDKWVQMVRQYTPGLLPGLQIAGDALMDQIQPLADGKRTDKYYVGSFIPQYAMANSAYKIATGKELPGARDPYDPYRAARAAAELGTGTAAPLTAEMASYAQQIAANVARNQPRYTNIPLNKQQEAEQAFIQSQQRAGAQRGLTQATGYVTGVPAYQWPAQEQAGRQMMDQYRQAGYNAETNPYGSKAAQTQVREQNPALPLWWQKGSAVPGQEGEPGVSAQLDPMYDQRNALYDQRQQQSQMAVDQAIGANPNIGGAAMSDARSAVYDQYGQKIDPLTQQIDALRSQLPADADPQSGYNPQELQQQRTNQVLSTAAQLPGRPDEAAKPLPPGDGATDAQWAAYKKAIAGYSTSWDSYRARQRQYVIDNLAAKEMGMPQYGQPYAGAMTPEQAVTAWEQYQVRNQSPLEQARRGEIEQQQPMWNDYYRLMDAQNYNGARQLLDANPWMKDKLRRDAQERAAGGAAAPSGAVDGGAVGSGTGGGDVPWFDKVNMGAVRRQQISALYGDEGVGMYDAYIALPKASEERAAYRAANPEIKLVLLAGFNPNEYGQMVEMFGADALVAWANVPAYAETEEAKNARSEYFKANPQAWLVQSWLRGRPTPITESGEVDEVQNNFGADWKLAEAQFGPEIWQLAAAYRAADAETRKQMRAVTPISAFQEWWYANLPDLPKGGPVATYISADGLVTYDQYGRRLDSLGNVARNNYNPTRRKSYPPRWQTPEIRQRYMDRNNQVNIEDLRQWRPINRANWWSVATDLKPDTPRPQRTSFK